MLQGLTCKLKAVHPEMDVCSGQCGALVPVEERMVLNEALEESRSLRDRIVVVARLRAKDSRLQGSEIANPISPTKLVY